MGFFISSDGNFQSWLAAFLCCCAAVNDDESPIEKERSRPPTRPSICNEQPLPVDAPPEIPSIRSYSAPATHNKRLSIDPSGRPPSLKPLDLGEGSFLSRWPRHSRQKSSKSSLGSGQRPVISAPHSFRRLDHTEAQRLSLVPLKLGPVVLRDAPSLSNDIPLPPQPTFDRSHGGSESTQDLLNDNPRPESYLANRQTPFQRCQQSQSNLTPWPQTMQESFSRNHKSNSIDDSPISGPAMSTRSSSSSLRRRAADTPTTPRSSSERYRPKRKQSAQSIRRLYGDSGDQDVDKEILELNTIVEERKADAARENSPNQHVPAIAPAMQVHARSETLDAIGSALSRPITAQTYYTGAGKSNDTTPERPSIPRSASSTSWKSSRVSGWLQGVFHSSSHPNLSSAEPFYKCRPVQPSLQRSYSEASTFTSLTELDSPSLTVASSPTSKGHSRSQTGESRMTVLSRPPIYLGSNYDTECTTGKKVEDNDWPFIMTPTSQVGIAL